MTVLLELLGRKRVNARAWLPWTAALFKVTPPTDTISEYAKDGLAYLMAGFARGARTGEAGEVTWAGCILWGLRPQNLLLPSGQAPRRLPQAMDERYFQSAVRAPTCPPTSCPQFCQRHDDRCGSRARRSTL